MCFHREEAHRGSGGGQAAPALGHRGSDGGRRPPRSVTRCTVHHRLGLQMYPRPPCPWAPRPRAVCSQCAFPQVSEKM